VTIANRPSEGRDDAENLPVSTRLSSGNFGISEIFLSHLVMPRDGCLLRLRSLSYGGTSPFPAMTGNAAHLILSSGPLGRVSKDERKERACWESFETPRKMRGSSG
jgi:hypothetical protein